MNAFDKFIAGEPWQLNQQTRSKLAGPFVKLSDGICHYDVQGPVNGEPIILIHGFSVPYFIWDPTIKALANEGFRVLRYDLFGRGFSDRPNVAYDQSLFRRQLTELIQYSKFSGKINLCCLSMGAVIAADFAKYYPKKISRLAFIDPAGFDLAPSRLFNALHIPVLGELILGLFGRLGAKSIVQSMLADFFQPTQAVIDAFVAPYIEQMQYQGFKRALLSSLRCGMLDENMEQFLELRKFQFPIQLIWGEQDVTVPFKNNLIFQQLLPRTQFHSIKHAGHIPHFEKPEEVNVLLLDFFHR